MHLSAARAILLSILLSPGAGMIGCDALFYHPNARHYGSPREFGLTHESVFFFSADGARLNGWFIPARQRPKGTLLHFHGNAGNVSGHFQHVAWLPAAGWNVLAFDYRGYGVSEGRPTRTGTIADGHAALDYLLSRPDVDGTRIVAFGQSLGGAVGIVVTAARPEIRGMITDGAFDHYQRIASWHVRRNPLLRFVAWWVPPLLMSKGHDPIDCIGRIAPRPILIMHGTDDSIVDPAMAQRLFDAAGQPKELWLISGADHYGGIQDRAEEVCPRLLRFLNRCVGEEPGS